ncbi:glycosyltransferase [Methylotuvimicrobium sp.]|uniref:glycosyltransferase n=1 Tax=Methylotuvimicrobium sp. TaxID=2822413 RepID=UPI003D6608F4
MRVFILPSWCPTADQPLSGTFFVEQAHEIARLWPGWTVALCCFDLARCRIPWRPWHILRFLRYALRTPRLVVEQAQSGLHEYRVWAPYLPRFGRQSKWASTAKALSSQARVALEDFIERFGKPDLIHAHAVYPGGAAAVALGREYGIAVGLTEHLGPFPPPALCLQNGDVMPLVTDTYASVSLCSAVSQALADRIVGLGMADEVAIMPNFLPDYFGSDHTNAPTQHDGFSFLSVGGPSHAKGTDVLLKALAQVDGNVTLRIVGDGPGLPFFQQMVADLGLTGRVFWLGSVPRDKMPEHYQRCDAFVLPSRGETFGIAFIEALSFGKPLIATRCGGPEDIVHAGNGLLVPLDDIEALELAMQWMTEHTGSYDSEALRSDFLARFSSSAVVARLQQWYLALKHGGQGTARL